MKTLQKALLILATVGSFSTLPAFANGGKAPTPFSCEFTVPPINRNQKEGPYMGAGKTLRLARTAAITECRKDLERYSIGACDVYSRDPSRMKCKNNRSGEVALDADAETDENPEAIRRAYAVAEFTDFDETPIQ